MPPPKKHALRHKRAKAKSRPKAIPKLRARMNLRKKKIPIATLSIVKANVAKRHLVPDSPLGLPRPLIRESRPIEAVAIVSGKAARHKRNEGPKRRKPTTTKKPSPKGRTTTNNKKQVLFVDNGHDTRSGLLRRSPSINKPLEALVAIEDDDSDDDDPQMRGARIISTVPLRPATREALRRDVGEQRVYQDAFGVPTTMEEYLDRYYR
jgi:hypothetical protein